MTWKNQVLSKMIDFETPKLTGIYFLSKGEDVVYVGQSANLPGRIGHHYYEKQNGKAYRKKDFDASSFIECDPQELNFLETYYIFKFKPIHNISVMRKSGKKVLKYPCSETGNALKELGDIL